ncbi:hypothetical protein D9M72_423610 [compost metagenome]
MRQRRDRAELAGVLDRVVLTEVRAGLQHHRFVLRGISGRREIAQRLEHRRVLAAEADLPDAGLLHAHERLAPEQAAALLRGAGVKVEAAFQYEQRLQSATEILAAAKTPARAGDPAGIHAVDVVGRATVELVGGGRYRAEVIDVLHVDVRDAVERDIRLREGASRTGEQCGRGHAPELHWYFSSFPLVAMRMNPSL